VIDPIREAVGDPIAKIGDIAAAAGIRRVDMVAWRDLGHPEAGGSELHAARIAERWVTAGIEVILTASRARGALAVDHHEGYRIERPSGRYGIFPTVAADRAMRRRHPRATVEIWNGMPFFSPLWSDRPRVVFLHHVHDRMWDLVLPPRLARMGRFLESRIAPPFYRHTPVVTLSDSSRRAIVDLLGFRPEQVHVVEPGVDETFCPGPSDRTRPLIVAVGRLVPYKRFDQLIDVLARLKQRFPDLEAVIAGEGTERAALQERILQHQAEGWLTLPGRIDDDALLDLYQRAWAVASTSAFEGWGLTITEAAGCGTPAVVSPISGHIDAVSDGVTGFLAEPGPAMEERLARLLSDPLLRRRMQKAAVHRASLLTWDRTALETMRVLALQH
jgi:glycosyltransferase involved in cell wall biosynthesis